MGKMKKLFGISGLIVFGFVLALIIADAGIRIANHWFPYFYCYDDYRGWGLQPGASGFYSREGESSVRINDDGFRGPDYSKSKPADTIRVAVLGDSYVQAIQVPENETLVAVIERELANCPALKGKRVQAINFGVDGYGTAQELITLKRKVWDYAPDIVVLAVFLGNDIRNNSVVLEETNAAHFTIIGTAGSNSPDRGSIHRVFACGVWRASVIATRASSIFSGTRGRS